MKMCFRLQVLLPAIDQCQLTQMLGLVSNFPVHIMLVLPRDVS